MIPFGRLPKSSKPNFQFSKLIHTFYKLRAIPGSDSVFHTVKKRHRRGSIKLSDPCVLRLQRETNAGIIYDLTDSSGISLEIFFSFQAPKYGCGKFKDQYFFVRQSNRRKPTLYLVFVKGPRVFPQILFQCFVDGNFNDPIRDIINGRKMQ